MTKNTCHSSPELDFQTRTYSPKIFDLLYMSLAVKWNKWNKTKGKNKSCILDSIQVWQLIVPVNQTHLACNVVFVVLCSLCNGRMHAIIHFQHGGAHCVGHQLKPMLLSEGLHSQYPVGSTTLRVLLAACSSPWPIRIISIGSPTGK